jgi:hypothetical protein
MTKKQAVALAKSGWWRRCSAREVALFQLSERRLCMDFGAFHAAVEKALGRSVWTHEFADPQRLRAELLGERPTPTMEQILDMIPAAKRIIVTTG